ncbi:MAG: B12-binding domain-containing radical SAM protein [Nitrospiraceae bacterium]|nr:MAG: B12-binding domain-containing radical SAM protein [Nitrospiraceae bacterium]
MKLLLISLQSNASLVGIKYIAGNARAKGIDSKILLIPGYLDSKLHPVLEGFIRDYNPDLIGISLMSIEFYPAKNITRLIKKKFNVPVIWGGLHAILKPDECIRYADFVCNGEGENAVVNLMNHLKEKGREVIPDIPNIWVNTNGRIIKKDALPETDLDSLPEIEYIPDYFYGYHKGNIYNFSQNHKLFRSYALYGGTCHMMITTRGCPFYCGYCANAYTMKVFGKKIRKRSVESCIAELKLVKKDPYVLYINFEDDWFFSHDMEWMKQFSEEYRKHINLPFMVRVFPGVLDREKLYMMREAGMSLVIMGVQSGSDRVNFEIYNRKVKFDSVIKAAEVLSECKAAPYYEMIVDNPYETEQDRMDCINAMSRLKRPYIISLAHLTFYPGTLLTQRALEEKIIDPEAYLTRYMVKIDRTYFNRLLYLTPYLPRTLIAYLNRPESDRSRFHILLTNVLSFTVKRTIEPAVFFYVLARGLKFNISWTVRTLTGNWKSALVKVLFNFLGKRDMEFDQKLELARRQMPELFQK